MRIFCYVAEHNSFSKAAHHLEMAAPLVSRHIASLEKHLGIRLFNRSTRNVELSEAGKQYYPRALNLIEQLEQLESEVSDLGQRASGKLKVSVPMDFGRLFLGRAFREFLSLFPHIRLQVIYEDRQAQLIDEHVDAVIRIGALKNSSMVARWLGEACIGCYASPEYLQQHGEPETPEALKSHQLLEYSLSSTPGQWHFESHNHTIDVSQSWRFSANNGRSLAEMATRGVGILRVPEFLVQDHIDDNKLVEVLVNYRSEPLDISLLYLQRKFKPVKITALADYLVQWFNEHRDWRPMLT